MLVKHANRRDATRMAHARLEQFARVQVPHPHSTVTHAAARHDFRPIPRHGTHTITVAWCAPTHTHNHINAYKSTLCGPRPQRCVPDNVSLLPRASARRSQILTVPSSLPVTTVESASDPSSKHRTTEVWPASVPTHVSVRESHDFTVPSAEAVVMRRPFTRACATGPTWPLNTPSALPTPTSHSTTLWSTPLDTAWRPSRHMDTASTSASASIHVREALVSDTQFKVQHAGPLTTGVLLQLPYVLLALAIEHTHDAITRPSDGDKAVARAGAIEQVGTQHWVVGAG